MTAVYVVLCAALWLGLIYVMGVEAIRLYLHRRAGQPTEQRPIAIPLGRISVGPSGGSHRSLARAPRA
jgi:hypothetical protein